MVCKIQVFSPHVQTHVEPYLSGRCQLRQPFGAFKVAEALSLLTECFAGEAGVCGAYSRILGQDTPFCCFYIFVNCNTFLGKSSKVQGLINQSGGLFSCCNALPTCVTKMYRKPLKKRTKGTIDFHAMMTHSGEDGYQFQSRSGQSGIGSSWKLVQGLPKITWLQGTAPISCSNLWHNMGRLNI